MGRDFVPPQLATLVEAPPSATGWVYEIKYDGYRLLAVIRNGAVTLYTRRGHDWTERFPEVAARLATFGVKSATIDGEIVALDPSGKSSFSLLQHNLDAHRASALTFFAFDLLHLGKTDLRELPLSERRRRLERLLRTARATTRGTVRLGQRLSGKGDALIRAACRAGQEGIIGKRIDARYTSGRSGAWVKVKCGRRQEFVVVGFTAPRGSRVGIGSLLLAVHEHGTLRYAGRVGSGMSDETLRDLLKRLEQSERSTSPLPAPPAGVPASARWVTPRLVVEAAFTEWTGDGLLRHPVFVGVREDKPAPEVRREEARMIKSQPAIVAGITITHPDRIVFPEFDGTKLDLARHFERVARVMLPHVAGRPLSLVRCPEGSAHTCFFQKHWTGKLPPSIDTVNIVQSDGKKHPHVVVHDVSGLVTLVQWGVMEIHPWGARADAPDKPDRITFDLDPGPGVSWGDIQAAADGLHGLLDELGLASWLKTSGGKGLHVVVPIARRNSWDEVSTFARAVAEHMAAEFPDRFVSKASKSARKGRIFVDWLRNTRGATAVAPWSTRARAAAGVSVPIPWPRLRRITSGDEFTLETVRTMRLNPDPWAAMLVKDQRLTSKLLARLKR